MDQSVFRNLDKKSFNRFLDFEIDGSFQMLNLLKFKDHVPETNLSGEAQYYKYIEAALPFFNSEKSRFIYQGKLQLSLIGPSEIEWDKILIVEYDSKSVFIDMVTSKEYPSEMRHLALADSRLILCNV